MNSMNMPSADEGYYNGSRSRYIRRKDGYNDHSVWGVASRKNKGKATHVLHLEKRTTQNGSMVCRGITKEQVKNLKIGITTIF